MFPKCFWDAGMISRVEEVKEDGDFEEMGFSERLLGQPEA